MATFNFFRISKFFLYMAFFSVIFVNTETLFPFIVTKYVFFRFAIGLALITFLFGWFFLKKEEAGVFEADMVKRLKSPLIVAVSLFVFVFLLAGFLGFNPHNSFWSNFERGEGGFQLLTFYAFFLLLTFLFRNEKDWLGVFKTSLAVAVLMIVYGFLAAAGVKGFIGVPIEIGQRFQGSLGNSAYVGTYLLFSLFYAFYMLGGGFGKINRNFVKTILWSLVVLFLIVIWLTQTRGPFLGLVFGIVAFLLYLVFRGKSKLRVASSIVLIVAVFFVGFLYSMRDAPIMKKLALSRFFNVTLNNISIQSRLWTWQSAFEGFKERPVLGWGPENFGRVFDKYFDTRHFIPNEQSETWYDRAHNVFFDYLVATGVLGLLSYVGIFAVFYIKFFKTINEHQSVIQNALIFTMPITYLVQGIVIFEILPIYISLFLFLAFTNFKFHAVSG